MVVGALRIYSLSKFQVHCYLLVIMLCISPPELTNLKTESLYLQTNIFPFAPLSSPWQYHLSSAFLIYYVSEILPYYFSVSRTFHLEICPPVLTLF